MRDAILQLGRWPDLRDAFLREYNRGHLGIVLLRKPQGEESPGVLERSLRSLKKIGKLARDRDQKRALRRIYDGLKWQHESLTTSMIASRWSRIANRILDDGF